MLSGVGVGVNASVAGIHGPRCSSGWPSRAAALVASVDELAGTSDTEHMSMGAHSQAGKTEAVARRQSLQ